MQNLIDNEIKILREKLNKLLDNGSDYIKIYDISLELDNLILKYSEAIIKK